MTAARRRCTLADERDALFPAAVERRLAVHVVGPSHGPGALAVRRDRSLRKGTVVIVVDVGHLPATAWAPYAAERWIPAPVAGPRLVSLPTAVALWGVAPARPVGQPSRMVAIAQVLAAWRAADRALTSLQAADPSHALAEATVEAARADYHRLFAEHRAQQQATDTL